MGHSGLQDIREKYVFFSGGRFSTANHARTPTPGPRLSTVPVNMIRPFYLAAVSLLILTVQVKGRDLQPATQRVDLCLNGQWQGVVAVDENTLPKSSDFNETLPVPGGNDSGHTCRWGRRDSVAVADGARLLGRHLGK